MSRKFELLDVFGIELEYMIVDKSSLNIQPIADKLFKEVTGEFINEVVNDRINWSNELVLHVVEFKNKNPESGLSELVPLFQQEVVRANKYLRKFGCQLMPGAMHPWMNPEKDTKLWPYENNEIYGSYDRIFGCKGHGWSNLQSLHINISFGGDEEFRKLHSAIRLILPLIPALSSSSPFYENKLGNFKSSRLYYYLQNQKRIPSIIGDAIPDVIKTNSEYQKKVLEPIYKDIAPFDPDGVLQEEWLNSRGAIPKFERGCIEIRLADVQESPLVDIAIADFWIKVIKDLTQESCLDLAQSEKISTKGLKEILYSCVKDAENALIENKEFLSCFGLNKPTSAKRVLGKIFEKNKYCNLDQEFKLTIERILEQGSLSTRIINRADRTNLTDTFGELANCLNNGVFFES